jgi:hypothetical protein
MKSPASNSNVMLQVASMLKRPLEADADGMMSLDFAALMLTGCLTQPHVRQNEGGWKYPRFTQDLAQEKSEPGVQNLFFPIL